MKAKTTIDNVYAEMRSHGAEPESDRSPRTHTRVSSRGSTHFRNVSGQGPPTPGKGVHKPLPSDKKKNALTKESEYGVQGIKAPLIEVAVKAEEIWGPALGGRERESSLKGVLESVGKSEGIFKVDKAISDCIKRKDYEGLVEQYSRARKYVVEAKQVAENTTRMRTRLTDFQIHQIVITGRMWSEVDDRITVFKREVWRRLTNVQAHSTASLPQDEHIALIGILLELGTEENPIWFWLLSRYDHLKTKITATFERSRVEIEVLRRQLANAEPPLSTVVASHLKNPARKVGNDRDSNLDTAPVLELWDLIHNSLNNLLSVQGGLLGEVLEFWGKAQNFIDGKAQKTLPIGIDGTSRKHHRLSTDGISALQKGAIELVEMLQDDVHAFFAQPPIEDISTLYSPVPNTPNSPIPATPQSATISPFAHQDSRFKFDENHPPPPALRRGEAWEEFAFWPPYANSLSGVHYLGKALTLLGSAASEMTTMRPVASGDALSEKSKVMINTARERCARASCAAWGADSDLCKYLEDWSRAGDQPALTNMPARFEALESTIFTGMQRILYIPEAALSKSGLPGIVSPPPAKMVHMVRTQFLTSIYKTLSGMVENAERPNFSSKEGRTVADDLTAVANAGGSLDGDSTVGCDLRLCGTNANLDSRISASSSRFPILLSSKAPSSPT